MLPRSPCSLGRGSGTLHLRISNGCGSVVLSGTTATTSPLATQAW
jgi:hypothetical protein